MGNAMAGERTWRPGCQLPGTVHMHPMLYPSFHPAAADHFLSRRLVLASSPVKPPTPKDVVAARQRIRDGIPETPCPESIPLSEVLDCRVHVKMDCLLRTGSFKERGARNALLLLDPQVRARGVVAASAGNHALGLAWHGRLLGSPVTVVMPGFAPIIKQDTCRRLGARVILHGEDFAAATAFAHALAARDGLTYIHGFRDPAIIAGAGVCGLEILDQVPDVQDIVVPVGGGGLAAGIALALKARRSKARLHLVEPVRAACLRAALRAGRPVDIPTRTTLADGLGISRIGEIPLSILSTNHDSLVTVTEDEIAFAILRLVELEKSVVEGAGAAGCAALLAGKLPELRGRRVVVPLCGGNIDPAILGRVLEKALVFDGRLARIEAVISDRPGGLARIAEIIASTGASIRDIQHDRAFGGGDVARVRVLCTVDTRDRAHIRSLRRSLRKEGLLA
jgi:threonine dehydratase